MLDEVTDRPIATPSTPNKIEGYRHERGMNAIHDVAISCRPETLKEDDLPVFRAVHSMLTVDDGSHWSQPTHWAVDSDR